MLSHGFATFSLLLGFVAYVGAAALLVLVFMVLLKANKLLRLKIDKAEADKHQQPNNY